MVAGGMISRISRTVVSRCQGSLIFRGRCDDRNFIPIIRNCFHSIHGSQDKGVSEQMELRNPIINLYTVQKSGISSSASQQPNENGTSRNGGDSTDIPNDAKERSDAGNLDETDASDKKEEEDEEDLPVLSVDDLIKLVAEKEGLLKTKHKEIEKMKDKVLRTYAEMENVMERTKREADNSKKFAIQVFKKFGVEKYDPTNEEFDPDRHNAVFQVPDPTKSPDTVAVVLKAGYMLHDRILRPAEVGVTIAVDGDKGSET
ncbi:GrpE nucleotide exchange factor [Cynara cardunculus var. scolymus]|uniref:GrpE protein homolog n=1 Tax=Cynara cardunculus var. scolymus TaxID=59895 RepID=A0A118JYW1_CYNCS|nr:GrpE nucleotide exchange factor [Cynara cardunculus var. scolymus]